MRPLDLIWLLLAVGIVAQQLTVRQGRFDPVALAAVAFFVGMIPAARADRRKDGPSTEVSETMKGILRRYLDKNGKDE